MKKAEFNIIAHIYNGFNGKFGVPRQSGILEEIESEIIFEKEFADRNALRGIEDFSHLWLLWNFSENDDGQWHPTVRPPRLGGNVRKGVFATRSPFRPNAIGLSSVRLKEVKNTKDGTVLIVTGADICSGTPIIDIKPYITYTDSHPDAVNGFAEEFVNYSLNVNDESGLLDALSPADRHIIIKMLEHDPRPAYKTDEKRVYAMCFAQYEVCFTVCDAELFVVNVKSAKTET